MRGYVPTKKEQMTIGYIFIFSDTKTMETEQQLPISLQVKLHGFDISVILLKLIFDEMEK